MNLSIETGGEDIVVNMDDNTKIFIQTKRYKSELSTTGKLTKWLLEFVDIKYKNKQYAVYNEGGFTNI